MVWTTDIFAVSIYAGNALNESNLVPRDIVPLVIENGKPTAFNDSFIDWFFRRKFCGVGIKAFDLLDGEINAILIIGLRTPLRVIISRTGTGMHECRIPPTQFMCHLLMRYLIIRARNITTGLMAF